MKEKTQTLLKRIFVVILTSAVVSAWGGMFLPQLMTAVYATDGVEYFDADGNRQIKNGVGEITSSSNPTSLDAGWYVVRGTVDYTSNITLNGDVHLILADGAALNIGTAENRVNDDGINGHHDNISYNLTVYGQSGGTGALNVYVTGSSKNGIDVESLTVNGGHVTADSSNYPAINIVNDDMQPGDPGVTVNGGELNANVGGSNDTIVCSNGSKFNFNGGKVRATATGRWDGINATGGYYLDQRSPSDEIAVTSFRLDAPPVNVVTIANGKGFVDEDGNIYSGSVSVSTFNDRALEHTTKTITLRPAYAVSISGEMSNGRVTADKEAASAGSTVALTVTPDNGYELDTLTVTKAGGGTVETTGSGNTYGFTMPGESVTVAAVFKSTEKKDQDTKVSPVNPEDKYASAGDNIAPVTDSKKKAINKLYLDFSNVSKSGVKPEELKMTVIKGTKFTVNGKLKDKDSAKGDSNKVVKVRVNKKKLTATVTCSKAGTGTAEFTMDDGVTYKITFTVENPKADKDKKKLMTDPEKTVIYSVKDLFGTDIDSGELTITKDKCKSKNKQATLSGNSVIIKPAEKGSVGLRYKYLNKKYNISINIKDK